MFLTQELQPSKTSQRSFRRFYKKKPRAKLLSDSHQGASICLESSTDLSWRQEKLELKFGKQVYFRGASLYPLGL